MSEHQYYEFRALDRPLDEQAQDELREISSRAEITSRRFTNVYNWGDLRADPAEMLSRWFDAFLHFTNWGTRWLGFRFPQGALQPMELAPYQCELLQVREDQGHTSVHFHLNTEDADEDWFEIDQNDALDEMLPLREALLSGDQRCLYLAWLRHLQDQWPEDLDEDQREPPVPPGLNQLDAAHQALVTFLGIDSDLLDVAALASAPLAPPDNEALLSWLKAQPTDDKDRWLLRWLQGDSETLRRELHRRVREERVSAQTPARPGRTAVELLTRVEALATERIEQLAQQRAEQQRLEAERKAALRNQHLGTLVGREDELWKQVDALIATTQTKAYDQAVQLLTDLRDLLTREGRAGEWAKRLDALKGAHPRKPGLQKRLGGLAP